MLKFYGIAFCYSIFCINYDCFITFIAEVNVMARKSGKLEAIQNTLKELDINISDIEKNEDFIYELIKNTEIVPDYRHPSYVRHLLKDILMICLFGVLADCNEWEEIADFAVQKEKWLRKYLELPNGVPSSDTIRVVIGGIDTRHFYQLVVQYLVQVMNQVHNAIFDQAQEKDILSMDGKESRGSKRNQTDVEGTKAIHTLNMYSKDYGICVEQEFIEEKSNEIPAGPLPLERLDLRECVVTWDALNTQKETVAAVIKGKGDYVAALKGNHPLFYKELQDFFSEEELRELQNSPSNSKKTVEKEHGGLAIREYFLTDEVGWYEDKKAWKNLQSFGLVKKKLIKKSGEKSEEMRYYINSIPVDINLFEKAVRGHWGVENKLHWQLDFTFKDDHNTTAEKTGAKNMQMLKKVSLAILRLVQTLYGQSLKRIRKTITRDCENELEQILSAVSEDAIKSTLYKKQNS